MESIEFLGFGIDAWITIVTVFTVFTVLLTTKWRSDIVFLGAIGVLYVTGVLDAKEAFSGFSSTSVITVGVLFVVVAGLMHTGVLHFMVKCLLGRPDSYGKAVTRLMLPVAFLSSFLSNTTVVALFVKIVKMWAKKLGVSPSKLLIPLSYASGMGGVCTLIGTPPNLIISGLYEEQTGVAMNILATTIPGLFCLAVGVLSVIAMRRLLPDRKAPEEAFEATSEYTVELRVPSDNPLIGKTLGEAGLFHVKGGSLIEICHIDDVASPVTENEILMSGDHLVFAGQIDELYDMAVRYQLVASDQRVFSMDEVDMNCQVRTAYVTFGSSLKGHSIAESTFEKDNNLMVAAVARRGERINEAPRKVVLEAGDTLLLICPKHFIGYLPRGRLLSKQFFRLDPMTAVARINDFDNGVAVQPPTHFLIQNTGLQILPEQTVQLLLQNGIVCNAEQQIEGSRSQILDFLLNFIAGFRFEDFPPLFQTFPLPRSSK